MADFVAAFGPVLHRLFDLPWFRYPFYMAILNALQVHGDGPIISGLCLSGVSRHDCDCQVLHFAAATLNG